MGKHGKIWENMGIYLESTEVVHIIYPLVAKKKIFGNWISFALNHHVDRFPLASCAKTSSTLHGEGLSRASLSIGKQTAIVSCTRCAGAVLFFCGPLW